MFLEQFRHFAYAHGRRVLSQGESLGTFTVQCVQDAFLESLPQEWGEEPGERRPRKIHPALLQSGRVGESSDGGQSRAVQAGTGTNSGHDGGLGHNT
jgi:hypothetical protein